MPTVMVLSHNRRSRRAGLVELSLPLCGSGHPPVTVKTAEVNFTCPKCSSLYEVVRAEAAPAVDPDITCPICGGPLPARQAQYALRYYLCGEPIADRVGSDCHCMFENE